MTPQTVLTPDACSIQAGPLRLVFRWTDDRWRHAVEIGDETIATSEEWDAEHSDPARVVSPAYQQLSHQAGRDVGEGQALLVGQWGRHHFSGVFTLKSDSNGVVIAADVALRTPDTIDVMAATYRVALGSSDLVDGGSSAIAWAFGEDSVHPGRLVFESRGPSESPGRVGLGELGRRHTRVQAESTLVADSRTQRLFYRWRWTPTSSC